MDNIEEYLKSQGLNELQTRKILEEIKGFAQFNTLKQKLLKIFEDNPEKIYNYTVLYLNLNREYDSEDIECAVSELILDNKIQTLSGLQLKK